MKPLKSNLDTTDWAILRELQVDARLPYAEIGRRVGLSSPAVQERVHRMEDTGIIKGYHTQIDPAKVGLPVTALCRIRQVNGKDRQAVLNIISNTREILHAIDITGEDGFVITIVATSTDHLDTILMQFSPYGQTITGILMHTYVENQVIDQQTLDVSQDK